MKLSILHHTVPSYLGWVVTEGGGKVPFGPTPLTPHIRFHSIREETEEPKDGRKDGSARGTWFDKGLVVRNLYFVHF